MTKEAKFEKLLSLQEDLIKEIQHLRLTTQKLIDTLELKESNQQQKEDIAEFWEDYLTGYENLISYIDSDESCDYFECKGYEALVILGTVLQDAYRDNMLGDGYNIESVKKMNDDTFVVKVKYEW